VERHALHERGVHARRGDEIADRARVVERGIDRRVGPGARDVREDALGAAALIQVVVDQRGAQPPEPAVRGTTSATSKR
jgi:hypothetical protein